MPQPAGTPFQPAHTTTPAAVRRVSLDALPGLVATRAPIVLADRPGGVATDDDLTYINRQAVNPLTAEDVYVIATESSNRQVDAYYTRMLPQTLQNFADDATAGVSFCDSHDHYHLPIGRTFFGQMATVERDNGGSDQVAQLLTYMLRGLPLSNGMNSDAVIRGVSGGVYKDISVGFKPIAYWCSICHCNMLAGYDCMHWPGQTYETEDGDEVCIADVLAHLGEHSLVYDGATPNAMVLKAQREMEIGRATQRQMAWVEDHNRTLMYGRWRGYGGGSAVGLWTPEDIAALPLTDPAASTAARAAADRLSPAQTQHKGDHSMRGSDLVLRFIEAYTAECTRTGKEVSAANLASLRAMHESMTKGHDTMREGLDALARFVDAKDGSSEPPSDNGEQEGSADAGAEQKANDESGDVAGGEDKADAAAPKKRADAGALSLLLEAVERFHLSQTERTKGSTPSQPGTDDGDGDDDEPPEPTGDAEGTDPGTKPKASKSGARKANPPEQEEEDEESAPVEDDDPDDETETNDGPGLTDADDHGSEEEAAPVEEEDDDSQYNANDESGKADKAPASGTKKHRAPPQRSGASSLSEDERALLDEARAARKSLLHEALAAGARAMGSDFDVALHTELLGRAPAATLRQFRDSWQAVARRVLGSRGEWVVDESLPAGGYWTRDATGHGGRQTAANDPNDPNAITAAVAHLAPGARLATGPARRNGQVRSSDPALYTISPAARRPRR